MNEAKHIGPGGGKSEFWLDRFLPNSNADGAQNPALTLPALKGFLYRQRYVMAVTFGLIILAALVATLLMTPIYKAASSVRVEPYGNNIVEGQDLAPVVPANEIGRYFITLGNVVESRNLAYRVADSLKLTERAGFLPDGMDSAKPDGTDERAWERQKRETVVDMLQGGVTAIVPFDSRIMSIEYRSPDPVLAAEIANAYADNFVLDDMRRSLDANAYAQDYLQEQIADVREKLQDAELAANAYARKSGIVKPLATGGIDEAESEAATITASNLISINQDYTDARARRIAAEQRWRTVASLPAAQLPGVQQSQVVQALVEQRSTKAAELVDLQQRYDDNYPTVVEARAQIAELDRQIARTGSEIKASVRNEYEIARRQEQALAAEMKNVTGESLAEQDRRVQYNLLDREARALRGQLASLLARFNEISTAANVKEGSITKLDAAIVPTVPVSPNLWRNMLAAIAIGLASAFGLAILREIFDDRLRTLEEVEERLGLPLLGHTPFIENENLREEIAQPFSALSESYASIVSSIEHALPSDAKVLQFTSSQASEGKSTTSMVVANQFAQLGYRTLLIDADLRRPGLSKLIADKRPEKGFADVLKGEAALADVQLQGTAERLTVLPGGKAPDNPVELLSSDLLTKFLDEQGEKFDRIIFDSSPVMGIADAPLLARHVDATVFVLEANAIDKSQARTAIRRLLHAGAYIPGIVMTKYRALLAGQYYGYEYQYYTYREAAPA